MGFDIECILNIQSLPGEYFCPVCRTLVYPNEALQTQCTHLYCKPCLTYIVNTNPACPYDGYLVTEVDAKPLIESDKVLAENIGKVRVHCLYHRSGCTWQGPFSECTSHCSVCSFGNSPVVCNRCGIQIVHRQVQEHAQTCPGANPQAPQAAESVQDAATSGTTAIAADQGQIATQAVTSTSQGTTSQTAAPPPLVQASSQLNTNPQAQAVSTAPVATPDQWYQQQYQQYYQQYPGYDPYQQSYQQYYPYQQQAVQQYQQHQPQQHPTQVQGQPQPQVYPQPQPQAQGHPPAMAPALAQAPPPPPPQPQPQPQPQMQGFPLTQPQPQVQSQPQLQIPPHGQTQPHPHVQAPVAPQHQNQPQVNLQHQLHPMVQPNAQVQSQPLLPPHSHPPSHPQPYPNAQPHPQVQPLPQPHMPVPPYQQSHLQMHNVQPHSQPQTQPQPLPPQPQPQFQPQPQPQPHVQVQLQAQPQHPSHPRPPQYPSHPNQQQIPNAPPQTQHQSAHAATGYHAYSQTQAHQQMQLANPQQHPVHTHPSGGPLPPAPMHGQFPPPPPHVRPPQSNAPLPNQQPTMMPLQGQVPPVQHQQIYPHPQQQSQPIQQRPVMQSNQQHQQYMQQHQPFAGQAAGPAQSQLNQHGNFVQQQPMQSQSRSQGPSQLMQQSPHAYPQTQQNVAVAHGMQPQQSQNYTGRQMIPHAPQSQPLPQSAGARGVVAQVRPVQHGLNQSVNQIYENRFNNQMQMSAEPERQEDHISGKSMSARSPSQKNAEKDVNGVGADPAEVKALKPEIDPINEEKFLVEQKDNIKPGEVLIEGTVPDVQAGKDVSGELASLQKAKEEGVDSTLAPASQVARYAVSEEKVASSEVGLSQPDDFSSRQAETNEEQRGKFPKDLADSGMKVSSGLDKGLTANVASVPTSDPGRRQQPPMHYGPPMHNPRSPASSMLHPLPPPGPHPNATLLRPEGPGNLPLSGQAINQGEHFQSPGPMQNHGSNHLDMPVGGYRGAGSMDPLGRGSSHFGPPNRSYGPLSGPPLGPPPAGSMDPPGGIMGRGPPHGPEGLQTAKVETELFRDQRPHHFEGRQLEPHVPGSMDRGSFGHASGIGANAMTVNGAPLMNSSSAPGLRDERFKPFAEERLDPFPVDHSRRQAPRPFDNAPSGFNYDAGGAPSRFLPPYHSAGNFLPNDAGERGLPVGPHDDERGRGGSTHMRPPFPGPVPGFAQHGMERLNPQSPGREFVGIASRGSGAGPGVSRGQFGFNDNDGREPHLFEGSRSFGPPSDSGGMSFNENRFPIFPGHSRRGEFDGGPGNRMGEHVGSGPVTHLRSGDPMGQDNLPSHLHRGEMMGPRNLRGHLHFGEGTEVGAFLGNTRMGDMAGPGNFPPRPPFGEPFGGNNANRPRLGEPGFRSSYSLPGFQNDGGFYAGGTDSFDRSRKRKPISMGWCRICRVDCESVEGLDLHAQTREHQKMAMDMVISIKKQNAKKLKPANDHTTVEEASKSRIAGFEARINKP